MLDKLQSFNPIIVGAIISSAAVIIAAFIGLLKKGKGNITQTSYGNKSPNIINKDE